MNPSPELVFAPDDVERPEPQRAGRRGGAVLREPGVRRHPAGLQPRRLRHDATRATEHLGIQLVDWVQIDFDRRPLPLDAERREGCRAAGPPTTSGRERASDAGFEPRRRASMSGAWSRSTSSWSERASSGSATARAIQLAHPGTSVTVLDKESGPGRHQSGRNSGVHPCGRLLRARVRRRRGCAPRAGSRWSSTAASTASPTRSAARSSSRSTRPSVPRLAELERRCRANGVRVELIDGATSCARSSRTSPGSPRCGSLDTGIADYPAVCRTPGRPDRGSSAASIALDTAVVSGIERAEGLVDRDHAGDDHRAAGS